MKKSKLVIEYDFDFELLGILSSARGYKLAWEINHALGIQLVKQPDLVVGFKNKPSDQESGKYFLIPEFPHYDFIILAAMEEQYAPQQLMQLIRSITTIQLVASIPLHGLKSKSNFIF